MPTWIKLREATTRKHHFIPNLHLCQHWAPQIPGQLKNRWDKIQSLGLANYPHPETISQSTCKRVSSFGGGGGGVAVSFREGRLLFLKYGFYGFREKTNINLNPRLLQLFFVIFWSWFQSGRPAGFKVHNLKVTKLNRIHFQKMTKVLGRIVHGSAMNPRITLVTEKIPQEIPPGSWVSSLQQTSPLVFLCGNNKKRDQSGGLIVQRTFF